MTQMSTAISEALAATAGQSEAVQAAAVTGAAAGVPSPSLESAGRLWTILVTGLVIALVIALIGVMYAVLDGSSLTSPDVMVTLFTAVLTGLIGLFVKSPVNA